MNREERLAAFENMLKNVKLKSVTYNQLMAEKLTLQKMLSMYEIYGIIEK